MHKGKELEVLPCYLPFSFHVNTLGWGVGGGGGSLSCWSPSQRFTVGGFVGVLGGGPVFASLDCDKVRPLPVKKKKKALGIVTFSLWAAQWRHPHVWGVQAWR